MRYDLQGLFWNDQVVRGKGRSKVIGPMPPIPETGWLPPSEFPNLSSAKVIGVDVETYDPELDAAGPGWGRGKGHVVGVSIAVHERAWYFPVRHETQAELNMDVEQVFSYLRHTLGDDRPKVGANLVYDLGWLRHEKIHVGGRLFDIQYAEALLNSETPDVSLEGLAERYLGRGKETSILYDWLAMWLGGRPNDRQRRNIYRAPVTLAGPYAEADAHLPLHILDKQWPYLHARGVLNLFTDVECRLIPLLVKMREKGAPVDLNKCEQLYEDLGRQADAVEVRLREIAGQPVNPAASESIKAAFVKLGIPFPVATNRKTKEKRVSFAADLLEDVDHPLAKTIVEHRQLLKVRNTFIKSYLIDKQVAGRIHGSFNALKSDKTGTRSGRLSSSDPNLQNIPVRTYLGGLVRECFVAHREARWRKWDYSQIEYRLLAHHAVGPGADAMRQRFIDDPATDYHDATIQLVKEKTGITLDRRPAKNINFGLIYGMSVPGLIAYLGLGEKQGRMLYESYHVAAPFIKVTLEATAAEIERDGSVTTLLGRKSDFPMWTASDEFGLPALPYDKAIMTYGSRIHRAFTHKGLNRKLQGGAADVIKKAMVDAYEAGLFEEDACGIPILTVHDELDFEDFGAPDAECWRELRRTLETCVTTRIPIRVDDGVGPNWHQAD